MIEVGLLVIVGSAAAVILLLWAAATELMDATRGGFRTSAVARAVAELFAAAALFAAPVVARRLAEARTGWVDEDRNGFADPMANGGYDWFDVNGGTWIRSWAAIALVVMVVAGVVVVSAVRRESQRESLRVS